MHYPKLNTSGRIVVETLHEHGPLSFDDALKIHKILGVYLSHTKEVYKRALDKGWITLDSDGVYSLCEEMRDYLDDYEDEVRASGAPEPTPGRFAPAFRPISSKHIPSAHARRSDAVPPRDIHFHRTSARPEPFRGEAPVRGNDFGFSAEA